MTIKSHEEYMRRAIVLSEKAGLIEKSGGCFGAVVVDKTTGEIIGEGYNHVIANNDPTWHGEMQAIREACKHKGSPHLRGCTLYTSAEPCPMCYTASMWARVDEIFYACTYADVKKYGNFEDSDFMKQLIKPKAERQPPALQVSREEGVEVWKKFAEMPNKVHY